MPDAGNILLICIFSSALSARRRTLSKKSKTDHALLLDKTALIKSRQPLDEKTNLRRTGTRCMSRVPDQ